MLKNKYFSGPDHLVMEFAENGIYKKNGEDASFCPYSDDSPPYYYKGTDNYWVVVGCTASFDPLPASDKNMAKLVMSSVWRWEISTPDERKTFFSGKQFEPIASQYRASNPKPALSEEIWRFQVMAISAVQEKRFGDAVNDYFHGLKIVPWWPQGHFNAALLLGQLHYYDEAIDHMKKYLMLVPGAPNARAAQDQIYKWQGERNIPSAQQ